MALALALAVARRIVSNDQSVRSGGWEKVYAIQLNGKTLGVIGTGNTGQRMIQLGKAIGMKVIAWTFHPSAERAKGYGVEFCSLERLVRESDVISLHVPLTKESRGLLGWKEFAEMKPTAILVNTARGAVVNEDALIDALRSKRIAGAGLDVYAEEPLPEDHALRTAENVVLSPHVSVMVPDAMNLCMETATNNVINFCNGQPTNLVNALTRRK